MKKLMINSILALTLLVSYACNTGTKESTDTVETAEEANEMKQDSLSDNAADTQEESSEFLVNAASGGLMEVTLGKLAQANGNNAEVKAFGKQMVTDHGKANEELKKLAAAKNITLPQAPGQQHQEHINELSALKGNEFDKKYIDMMVKDH